MSKNLEILDSTTNQNTSFYLTCIKINIGDQCELQLNIMKYSILFYRLYVQFDVAS